METKALLFDCFGVITERVLGNWVPEGLGPDFDPTEIFEKLDLGEMSEADSLSFFAEKAHRPADIIRAEIDSHFKPNTELLDLIKNLKIRGYTIILLSNASNDFFERFVTVNHPNFLESFDDVIVSSKVKMVKPNRDIYEYALNRHSLLPHEALFIDDSKNNIVGAEDVGIPSILFKNNSQLKDDLIKLGINI